jgi:hypothetical protein
MSEVLDRRINPGKAGRSGKNESALVSKVHCPLNEQSSPALSEQVLGTPSLPIYY